MPPTKDVKKKREHRNHKYTEIERYEIGKYATEFGVPKTVNKFKEQIPTLGPKTVRSFRDMLVEDDTAALKMYNDHSPGMVVDDEENIEPENQYYSPAKKTEIGKYASVHGIENTLQEYKEIMPTLTKATIASFHTMYGGTIKDANKDEDGKMKKEVALTSAMREFHKLNLGIDKKTIKSFDIKFESKNGAYNLRKSSCKSYESTFGMNVIDDYVGNLNSPVAEDNVKASVDKDRLSVPDKNNNPTDVNNDDVSFEVTHADNSGFFANTQPEIVVNNNTQQNRYNKYTALNRYEIGKFAHKHGVPQTIRKYSPQFNGIGRSTVKTFKSKYEQGLSKPIDCVKVDDKKSVFADPIQDRHIWKSDSGLFFTSCSQGNVESTPNVDIELISLIQLSTRDCEEISKNVRSTKVKTRYFLHMLQDFTVDKSCPKAVMLTDSNVFTHFGHLLSGERWKCDECVRSFPFQSKLIAHKATHSSEKKYFCKYCPASYKTKNSLDLHVAARCQGRPYICDICSDSFATTQLLEEHKTGFHKAKRKKKNVK